MHIVWIVLTSLLVLAGWLISLIGLSGTWLVLLAVIGIDFALDGHLDFLPLNLAFAALCGLVEVIEFVSGLYGARRFGGSAAAGAGAFAGTLVGGILGSGIVPILGTMLGAVAGCFLGALLSEFVYLQAAGRSRRAWASGMKAGFGALLARVVVVALKAGLAAALAAWYVWVVARSLATAA